MASQHSSKFAPLSWTTAVFSTTLLNLLDALTYGQVIFPFTIDPFFQSFGLDGFCLFLVTTAISQAALTFGSSFQRGAVGCMIVEAIPFIQSIALISGNAMSASHRIASLLVGMMLLTIFVSFGYLLLGLLKLEWVVGQLPKPVLVGAMGGIGAFVLRTGFELVLKASITSHEGISRLIPTIPIWGSCIVAASIVMILERRPKFGSITTFMPIILFVLFYLLAALYPIEGGLDTWRRTGWLFDGPTKTINPFRLLLLFRVSNVDWNVVLKMLPTITAGAIFNLIHVPINVPSFARISGQSFRLKREFYLHAISNFLTAFTGLCPNYFVYTNSLIFYRAGGTHRIAGYMLSLATTLVLMVGQTFIRYVPTISVLYLLFYMGFELLKEALVKPWLVAKTLEYCIIMIVMVSMMILGFVPGLLVGLGLNIAHSVWSYTDPLKLDFIDGPIQKFVYRPAIELILRPSIRLVRLEGTCGFYNSFQIFRHLSGIGGKTANLIVDLSKSNTDMNIIEGMVGCFQERSLAEMFMIVVINAPKRLGRLIEKLDNVVLINNQDLNTIDKALEMIFQAWLSKLENNLTASGPSKFGSSVVELGADSHLLDPTIDNELSSLIKISFQADSMEMITLHKLERMIQMETNALTRSRTNNQEIVDAETVITVQEEMSCIVIEGTIAMAGSNLLYTKGAWIKGRQVTAIGNNTAKIEYIPIDIYNQIHLPA